MAVLPLVYTYTLSPSAGNCVRKKEWIGSHELRLFEKDLKDLVLLILCCGRDIGKGRSVKDM